MRFCGAKKQLVQKYGAVKGRLCKQMVLKKMCKSEVVQKHVGVKTGWCKSLLVSKFGGCGAAAKTEEKVMEMQKRAAKLKESSGTAKNIQKLRAYKSWCKCCQS